MPLTKEQLLIPRYMCTGTPGKPLWYGSPFKHGFIINSSEFENRCYKIDEGTVLWGKEYLDYFQHLFQPMKWWEGRQPEEMPKYISVDGGVFRIDLYDEDNMVVYVFTPHDETAQPIMLFSTLPATEQEYNEYQKQKEETNEKS